MPRWKCGSGSEPGGRTSTDDLFSTEMRTHTLCGNRLPRFAGSTLALLLAAGRLSAATAGLPLSTFQQADFVGSGSCAACHSLLSDAARQDVSIDLHWRSSMMANSGKDPLWQAKVASETRRNPALKSVIEDKCATCHLPMARTQAVALGSTVAIHGTGFLDPANAYHAAATDGVSCSLCHQIQNKNLGLSESFSGHYSIDTTTQPPNRVAYGPFANPILVQMQNNVGFTPVQSAHITSSAMCGTCHNLRTPYVDAAGQVRGEFPEQMVYSEWEHSGYNTTSAQKRSCQDCHMPVATGGVILSNRGGPGLGLTARSPFGQHHFVGGNVFMLDLLAANVAPLQLTASTDQFAATRVRTLTQLQRATAVLSQTALSLSTEELIVGLHVQNLVGHKLPAGLPSRRTWLHLEVKDATGAVIFSSGAPQADGRIAGNDADVSATACEPHYDLITRPDQVQIYEAVMENTDGAVTYTLLRGARYRKDNRLLPAGFSKDTAAADIAPTSEAKLDQNFVGGGDDVVYRIDRAGRTGPFTITARLLHQTVSHAFAADLVADAAADPAIASFASLYQAALKTPATLAQLELTANPVALGESVTSSSTRLLNISSRTRVGGGEAAAIAGFVLTGQEARQVLLRAVGPSLAQAPFNLTGVLADPRLELYRSGTLLTSNTGVGTGGNSAAIAAAAREVGAFALGESGKDSAILTTLVPGEYTAVVSSASAANGVVLVEVYDLAPGTTGQKLLNISTRATVGSGDNTLITGIVLAGVGPRRMLFRAAGPGLARFGVSGTLAQPTLTLFQGGQQLASNTNWATSPDAAAIAVASASVSAFGLANGDSALLATLAPGSYTAQVTGPGGATGIVLIEAYDLP